MPVHYQTGHQQTQCLWEMLVHQHFQRELASNDREVNQMIPCLYKIPMPHHFKGELSTDTMSVEEQVFRRSHHCASPLSVCGSDCPHDCKRRCLCIRYAHIYWHYVCGRYQYISILKESYCIYWHYHHWTQVFNKRCLCFSFFKRELPTAPDMSLEKHFCATPFKKKKKGVTALSFYLFCLISHQRIFFIP